MDRLILTAPDLVAGVPGVADRINAAIRPFGFEYLTEASGTVRRIPRATQVDMTSAGAAMLLKTYPIEFGDAVDSWVTATIDEVGQADVGEKAAFGIQPHFVSPLMVGRPVLLSQSSCDELLRHDFTFKSAYCYDIAQASPDHRVEVAGNVMTFARKGESVQFTIDENVPADKLGGDVMEADRSAKRPIDRWAKSAGYGQSYASLHASGRTSQHTIVSSAETLLVFLSIYREQGLMNVGKLKLFYLAYALYISPWMAAGSEAGSGGVGAAIADWIAGRQRAYPWMRKIAVAARRPPSSYDDVATGFVQALAGDLTVAERSEGLRREQFRGLSAAFRHLGMSDPDRRAEEIQERERKIPEVERDGGNTISGYATVGWMNRIQWCLSALGRFPEVHDASLLDIEVEFTRKLVLRGWPWAASIRGVGEQIAKYAMAMKGIAPRIHSISEPNHRVEVVGSFEEFEDIPLLMHLCAIHELDLTKGVGLIDSGSLAARVKAAADGLAPSIWPTMHRLRQAIPAAQPGDADWPNALRAHRRFSVLISFLLRPSIPGYPDGDKVMGLANYITPERIRKIAGSDTDSEVFEDALHRRLDGIPDMRPQPMDAFQMTNKATSSGPGNGLATHPRGERIPLTVKLGARLTSSNLRNSRSRFKDKNVVTNVGGPVYLNRRVRQRAGSIVAPGSIGRRNDVLKRVRYIYLIVPSMIYQQFHVHAALKHYEKDRANPQFKNLHFGGNSLGNMLTLFRHNASARSSYGSNRMIVNENTDFPAFDNYVRIFMRVLHARARAGKTPFTSMTEEERADFVTVYNRFAHSMALFQLSEGDSSNFPMFIGSLTSGDAWTSTGDSLNNDVMDEVRLEFFEAYREAGGPVGKEWLAKTRFSRFADVKADVLPTPGVTFSVRAAENGVFGDDQMGQQVWQATLPLSREQIARAAVTSINLTVMAIKGCSFGSNPDDIVVASNYTNFLNNAAWGWSWTRRSRNWLVREKRGGGGPVDRADSLMGEMVVGGSLRQWWFGILFILITARDKAARGRTTLIPPYTFILPRTEDKFIPPLPFPMSPYPAMVTIPGMVPSRATYAEMPEVRVESLGASLLQNSTVRLEANFLEYDAPPGPGSPLDRMVTLSSEYYIDKRRIVKGYPPHWSSFALDQQMRKALELHTGEALEKDTQLGPAISFATKTEVVIKREAPVVLQRKFDVGFDTTVEFTQGIVGAFFTDGRGGVAYYARQEGRWVWKWTRPLGIPIYASCTAELMALACVYGLTTEELYDADVGLGTGGFSPNAIPGERVMATLDSLAGKPWNEAKARAILRVFGFFPSEISRILESERTNRFKLLVERVNAWGKFRIPELTFSTEMLERVVAYREELTESDPNERGTVDRILRQLITTITVADGLVQISGAFEKLRRAGGDPDVDLLWRDRICVGRVFELKLGRP